MKVGVNMNYEQLWNQLKQKLISEHEDYKNAYNKTHDDFNEGFMKGLGTMKTLMDIYERDAKYDN
jgi:hypothetical protein